MRKTPLLTRLAVLLLVFVVTNIKAQTASRGVSDPYSHIFDPDSLQGFDEELAKQAAFDGGYFGDEFKVFMYNAKRSYINARFNVRDNSASTFKGYNPPSVASAACINDDFENVTGASAPGSLNITTTSLPGGGWTVDRGNNTNSCVTPTFPNPPNEVAVIGHTSSTGYIDPVIGAAYPIFSVFGPTTAVNSGTSVAGNATITPNMYGNYFLRINDQNPGTNEERITRCFTVTPTSALFQFAFMIVADATGHPCCGQPSFHINLYNGCSGPLISCPNFSYTIPGASCTGTVPFTLNSGAGTYSYFSYNKWKVSSIDLTPYIGSTIKVEVIMTDCNGGAHAGYMYFDSQCAPMDIIGNGSNFPAGTPNITLPTCGAGSSATITAPPGLGPYSWVGPTGFVPSSAQTITTNITGNYTLTMNPIGSCTPVVRTVSVVISPAPNLAITSQTQVSCTTPTNAISLSMASGIPNTTITPNYVVSFAPCGNPTGTIGVTAGTATYSGLCAGINTITITDQVGCQNSTTVNVAAAPPVPSFSISTPSGTVVGCNPNTIQLCAVNTNTSLTSMTYTWTSTTTGTATGTCINGSVPSGTATTYTVYGSDNTVGSCVVSQTIAIAQNTTVPAVSVNPPTKALTCNGAPATFTAVCTPTTNTFGQWYDASNTPLGAPSSGTVVGSFNSPGVYTASFVNITNGCVASQTVSVTAPPTIPTMTVNALNGFTITCNQPCLTMNISASAGPAPKTYSWTNMTTTVTTTPATGGYTICTPGNYLAEYMDGNLCRVSQMISVSIDTSKLAPTAITNLPSNSFTLNCYHPVLTATAISNPMMPAANYSWTQPPNLTVSSDTMRVTTGSVTANPTTFTVLVKGPNGCVGRQKIFFYKDVTVPAYTAVFTPSALTCSNQFVAMSPNYVSGPSGPTTFTFVSPPPTTTNNASGAQFGLPGTYTMNYTYVGNGCAGSTTTVVPLNVTPPATVPITPTVIPCGSPTVMINAGTTSQPNYYTYTWDAPTGAGMSCPGGANCYSTTTNMVGIYEVVITNTINGCTSNNTVAVTASSVLPVSFTADQTNGFPPLTVNFNNTTVLGSATVGSVTTTWSYGNGLAYTFTNTSAGGTPNGLTTYNAPGSYTVLLVVQQSAASSTCVGTATTVINVDIPSALTVPNVFTPNGDGVNDVFIVQSTSISNINCIIFDRWGVKVYDVTSDKGQIGWDGKNLSGKEVPAGTYFFVLKATGKDGNAYEQKGTVSLYR